MIRLAGVIVLALLALHLAAAAPVLRVNGVTAGPADQETVPGVTYAEAAPFAAALGAELTVTAGRAVLRLGAHSAELAVSSDPALVFLPPVMTDGVIGPAGHAALNVDGRLLLPVKMIANAFGAHVTVLSGREDAVEVRLPQARLTDIRSGSNLASGRLTVALSAPAAWSAYFNSPRNTLELRFRNTRATVDQAALPGPEGRVRLTRGREGDTEVHVRLAAGETYSLETRTDGSRWELEILISPHADEPGRMADQGASHTAPQALIVIDPGEDAGLQELGAAVISELEGRGVAAAPASRVSGSGHALVQLRRGPVSAVTVLADAADATVLAAAVAEADGGDAAVAALRRALLLGRTPATGPAGRELAERLASAVLGDPAQVRSGPFTALSTPLGAAVRLELAADSMGLPDLTARIARGLGGNGSDR